MRVAQSLDGEPSDGVSALPRNLDVSDPQPDVKPLARVSRLSEEDGEAVIDRFEAKYQAMAKGDTAP
jgi:hypothetical protein